MKYDVETRDELAREKGAAKPERAAEAGCEERARFLEGVLDNTDDGIIATDASGNVTYMNPAARKIFGFGSGDEGVRALKDPALFEARYPDGRAVPSNETPMSRASRGMAFGNEEMVLKRRDTGREFIGSYSGSPVRDRSGKLLSNVITVRDVSARAARAGAPRGVIQLPAILGLIAASLPRVVMANRCDIVLYDEKDRTYKPVETIEPKREGMKEERLTCVSAEDEKLFTRRVMETKKPLVVEDTKEHPLCTANRNMIERLGIKSIVVLPLVDRDHFLGAMMLDSNLAAKDFSDQSMDTLNLLAKTVSAVITEARAREERPVEAR